jgi:hypothetical protein
MRARSWHRRSLGGEHRSALAQGLRELDGLRRRVRPAREHLVGELNGRRGEHLVCETNRESSRLGFITALRRPQKLGPSAVQSLWSR